MEGILKWQKCLVTHVLYMYIIFPYEDSIEPKPVENKKN
jgi:hypothetical protein